MDGLYELAIGGSLILIGLSMGVRFWFPEISTLFLLPLALGIPLLFVSLESIKNRLNHPTIGQVTAHTPRKFQRYLVLGGLFVVLLVSTAPFLLPDVSTFLIESLPLLGGMVTALALLWLGAGIPRFYYLAAASVLIGATFMWLRFGQTQTYLVFFLSLGLLTLGSGIYALLNYRTPKR